MAEQVVARAGGAWSGPTWTQGEGHYGPRGWTVRAGVWRVLLGWPDELRDVTGVLDAGRHGSGVLTPDGSPREDYVPFTGLDAATARELLDVLPGHVLADRQNLAPTLGALLRACARSQDRVRLSGYGIGPQRVDERLSVEALWVGDADLLGHHVDPVHSARCQCVRLWEEVSRRYELDARCGPDEVRLLNPVWADGAPGWWMWWD